MGLVNEVTSVYEDHLGNLHTHVVVEGGTYHDWCQGCRKLSEAVQRDLQQWIPTVKPAGKMQEFATGATRSDDSHKPDYEGFLSPLVLADYAAFMQTARLQDDGKLRASDNWQRGIPFHKFLKSLWRHLFQLWKLHRGYAVEPEMRAGKVVPVTVRSAIHGIMFNSMGYLHEYLMDTNAWENRTISELEDGTVVTAPNRRKQAA